MKSVAPSRRARAASARLGSAGSAKARRPPRCDITAGRGRSVGSSSAAGAPDEVRLPARELPLQHLAREPPALPDARSPRTAPAAAASGDGSPARKAA